ncbi:nucleotidyltransferase family protein [Desulfurococcaceae archaeon MEX13E-LK6-19]|nr:nucleotidyltransferase family protein [Desulfurococcaceae archaeon MEX13E-LK6-19]
MRVKAAVLGGGLGKRLRPLTYYFQKVMIPIGKKQKPLLEYIIKLLKYHGIRDVVMLVGYKHEQIINYFEDGSRFGVNIEYVIDEPGYSGTGGALLNAYRKNVFEGYDSVLVYYGDILTNMDLSSLLKYHEERDADATLAVASKYQVPVGVVEVDEENRVMEIREKPWLPIKATIGILVLKTSTLKVLEEIRSTREKIDIMGDFIPELIKRGAKVYAYLYDGEWFDVGTTERYEKLDNEKIDNMFKEILAA